jgi:branched-chain amino acid transport system substrate-binding protein
MVLSNDKQRTHLRPLYFFLGVIITISIGNGIIVLADSDSKLIYSNWILIINSLIAVGVSSIILFKDKDDRSGDKTNILLTMGLVFWFLANIVWAYYEVVMDIVSPVPSLADLFLLSAYGFLIYRLTIIYRKIDHTKNKKTLFLVASGAGLFLIYILNLTLNVTDISSYRGFMLFVVTIAYPTLNSILTVLALMILLDIKKEKHHFIPWVCELCGLLAIVVGDSWFAIIVLTTFVEQLWASALLLSAHYLLIAGGLLWHLRYHVKWPRHDIGLIMVKWVRGISYKRLVVASAISVAIFSLAGFYFSGFFEGNGIKQGSVFEVSSFVPQSGSYGENGKKDFVVGAILPLTGSLSSMGKSVKIALEKANHDVNQDSITKNSSSHFNLLIADSKTSPEESLASIKKLHQAGAKIILGPATSTAVSAVKEYADKNNLVLISYASTSPLLSIPGDSLFRLVPDDTYQGKKIAERLIGDGVKVIVPLWRGDIYGNQLFNSTKTNFEALGGKVEEGVNYKPYTGKFAASLHRINFIMWNQDLAKLSEIVSKSVKRYGPDSVAVYVISYDEITPILIQSQLYDILEKVKWYGSDSIAQNHHVTKNVDSALFAIKTHLSNPLFSIQGDNKKEYIDLMHDLEKELHEVSSITYPAVAYDSYWIAALSLYKNSTFHDDNFTGYNTFKRVVVDSAESFSGLSGKIKLNAAGDRLGGNYDFWTVAKDNITGNFEWEKEHFPEIGHGK